jgi:protein phosphatase
MVSRAIVVVCRDEDAARARFGIVGDGPGICYTRTGRRFFDDRALETQFLATIRDALDRADFWSEFATDWACLDGELLPWSAKAQELLRGQYAAGGSAATAALALAVGALDGAGASGVDVAEVRARFAERADLADRYVAAYGRYCWPVDGLADLKYAPFRLLATEGRVHLDRDHEWHLAALARLRAADGSGLLHATAHLTVDVTDPEQEAAATAWWAALTGRGGEGMVVKPRDPIVVGRRGLVQPGIKVRGPEYLRIIYGPEYDRPDNLTRLKARRLGAKRALAGRESSRSGWRRWNASPGASRCGGSTSASSVCWRWRASRSTPGSRFVALGGHGKRAESTCPARFLVVPLDRIVAWSIRTPHQFASPW